MKLSDVIDFARSTHFTSDGTWNNGTYTDAANEFEYQFRGYCYPADEFCSILVRFSDAMRLPTNHCYIEFHYTPEMDLYDFLETVFSEDTMERLDAKLFAQRRVR